VGFSLGKGFEDSHSEINYLEDLICGVKLNYQM
jgi:hypothetical protein